MCDKFNDSKYMDLFRIALQGSASRQYLNEQRALVFAETLADMAWARINGARRKTYDEICKEEDIEANRRVAAAINRERKSS